MAKTVTIMDPVTRIEGHMKVEVTIDTVNSQLQVVDARSTGTLFRGFETLLQGRDPWDAPVITERICGVCPVSHGMAAVKALDAAAGVVPPTDARILRNLVLGANFIQSHILHFYILAALDYAHGPNSAPWTPAWDVDMRSSEVLDKVVADHLPLAVVARRQAHEMGAIFGGRMPSPQAYIPGGFTAVPSEDRINEFRGHLNELLTFTNSVYIGDVLALAGIYEDYYEIGQGSKKLLAYGVFDLEDTLGGDQLLNGGIAEVGGATGDFDADDITESVKYSWYNDATDQRNPSNGSTDPVDPHNKGDAYSWLKAPRYEGKPFEVGALARMWMLDDEDKYSRGVSVMDRHAARALETRKIGEAMNNWLDELTPGANVYDGYSLPNNTSGIGLTEAPRGALGHWVGISENKIDHYQIITPTCWNASPMDTGGINGPMEQALIGTPIQNEDQPIEALRVIHSFDPCLSCAVHIMRPDGEPVVIHTGPSNGAV
jgi:hydrogenase large subunit